MADTCALHDGIQKQIDEEKERNQKEHDEIKKEAKDTYEKIFTLLDKINGKMWAVLLSAVGVLGAGFVGAVIYIATALAKKGTP